MSIDLSPQSNKDYFVEIYNNNFKFIYRYFYKRVPNFQDAEDLTSEVFGALWASFENIHKDKDIKFYIIAIAKNKLNDFLRKKYKFDPILLDSELLEIAEVEDGTNEVNNKEANLNIISTLIVELSDKYRTFYELKYKENMTYSKISLKLNITENNAKVLNNRLIKKLKELWTMKKA